MAATVSISFSLDPRQYHHHHCHLFSPTHHFKYHQNRPLTPFTSSTILPKYPLSTFPKSDCFAFKAFVESFAEWMLLLSRYVSVLGYLVKQYLFERMELLPNTATLIAFYRRRRKEED
ncbi:hypothetical protein D8674_034995 [Pyrus ussuriensis x Pyrus communis]|uniref:Uncharacterized protein n=1 Tax=Pyrus ussuriensis x Pyrus communis TaxID=2448454 RepID=A0A5N5GB54_9ROSA|nr:hypothetical protein D8674_034995 [Pyrus ussuriensis x Pyrus communis]